MKGDSMQDDTTAVAAPALAPAANQVTRGDATSRVCIQIFIFRGDPDVYYKRHTLLYFTCPDVAGFFQTVHTQRDGDKGPWVVHRHYDETDWVLDSDNYEAHVNAGAVVMPTGQEMRPVEIVAGTPVGDTQGEEADTAWNDQHFVLAGLQRLVDAGLQTSEWYEVVEGEMMEKLLEGAVE